MHAISTIGKRFFLIALAALMVFALTSGDRAWAQEVYAPILSGIEQDGERLVGLFKEIHSDPELSFMETQTSAMVDRELKKLGYETITSIAQTGVVGILKNGEGPTVMYRADMDALPVKETADLPYASKKTVKGASGEEFPVMHACGHDAHITWMLGAAKVMAEHKDKWKGTLVLVAQPAEEIGEGAQAMVADRMYERGIPMPDYLMGMHTSPLPVGAFVSKPGELMAGMDQLDVTFYGIGGHGSLPHLTKDPVVMSALAINSYQAIISRGIDPQHAAVISVGAVQAGESNNVIPPSALLKINLRWFNEKDRERMVSGIQRINEGIAYSYGLEKNLYPKMERKGWASPLINDKDLTEIVQAGFQTHLPEGKNITDMPSLMGSEDFHHLVLQNPKHAYTFVIVGVSDPKRFEDARKSGMEFPYAPHNSDYVVDLKAIPYGVKLASIGLLSIFEGKTH